MGASGEARKRLIQRIEHLGIESEVSHSVVEWALELELFGDVSESNRLGTYEKELVVATVFVARCSPMSRSMQHREHAIRMVVLFLWLDDVAGDDSVVQDEWDHISCELLQTLDGRSVSNVGVAAWGRWLTELLRWAPDLPRSRSVFLGALRAFFEALAREREIKGRPDIGLEAYWGIRRNTIFVEVFVDYWRICQGIELSEQEELDVSSLRRLACDVTIISNDIASVLREHPDRDLNLAFLLAREHGCTVERAAESMVSMYNAAIADFRAKRDRLLASGAEHVSRYIDVLIVQIDGNLQSMVELSHRYPDSVGWIERLERLA